MKKEEAFQVIVSAINNIQKLSGRDVVPITADTLPASDLPGFDSANGLELTCDLADLLKINIPLDENILVSVDGKKALTIGEIASRLCSLADKPEG